MLIIRCFFIANLKGGDRMKIKVTTAFNDRQCSDKRAMELMSLGYAERVEDEQPKGKLTKTKVL